MEDRTSFAEVAVDAPVAQRTFTYSVPKGLQIIPGQLVWVPFGSRVLQGIVLRLSDTTDFAEIKEIGGVISPTPVLAQAQIELAAWISQYYLCPLFAAASLMLPPGFERRILTYYSVVDDPSPLSKPLGDAQKSLFLYVQRRGVVELRQLEKAFRKSDVRAVANRLVRRGLFLKTEELERERIRPKKIRYVKLVAGYPEVQEYTSRFRATRKSERLRRALEILGVSRERITFAELAKLTGVSGGEVGALARDGLVAVEEQEVFRDPLARRPIPPSGLPELTADQERIFREISASLRQTGGSGTPQEFPKAFLLHGVTGSGKTEIYLRALAATIERGMRAIVAVPEIALTPQTAGRFLARFPGRVAVLHSKLSAGEQYDEWRRIKAGEFDVVIGSRSSIFAPVDNLGLIVLDEEHEWSYKQTDVEPRYHARDVAIKLAELAGASVILGSATPDVSSYRKALDGVFKLVELPERVASSGWASKPLPSLAGRLSAVEIVDLRQELKAGNRSIFSRSLRNAMTVALAAHEQVILFLNRRGTSTFVICRDCGYVLRCKRCDAVLTYHSAEDDMVCHLCNRRSVAPGICPNCLSPRIRYLGVGTQKVEEEVRKAFPEARLLRWDRDAAVQKGAHEQILDRFTAHEADILIGTQMIAKGLDLPTVTLVGVVCADIGLHLPDFRASEHTFQILTQVAGRAGRGVLQGKTVIQTYSPEHYAIAAASRQDYTAFYNREIVFRDEHDNPPFSQLAKLSFVHPNAERCRREALKVSALLKQSIASHGLKGVSLIGPAPAYIGRLRGRYRWQIVVRGRDLQPLIAGIPLSGAWAIDIDPVSLL